MLDRDTRDSMMMPTSGYNINILGAFAPDLIGSTNGFYRAEIKGSVYYPLFDKAIILMAGAKFGVVGGFSGEDAPIFERYFLGGGDSLRGFEYHTMYHVLDSSVMEFFAIGIRLLQNNKVYLKKFSLWFLDL